MQIAATTTRRGQGLHLNQRGALCGQDGAAAAAMGAHPGAPLLTLAVMCTTPAQPGDGKGSNMVPWTLSGAHCLFDMTNAELNPVLAVVATRFPPAQQTNATGCWLVPECVQVHYDRFRPHPVRAVLEWRGMHHPAQRPADLGWEGLESSHVCHQGSQGCCQAGRSGHEA